MLKIGSVLDGKYKILSEIGHGGMSVVYMALNEKANKTWAVKEIRKNGKMDFNVVRQGLVSEIDTLKRLKHPSLPSIVDVIEDEDTFIIVMDYIEGNSLDKSLKENGAQSQENVIEWAKQLCNVLGYLHSCNPPIIYRDMKPANIMLKPNGDIALIDFGTAKTYEIDLGETTGIGTIGYAAPEQYIGSGLGRTDARTDIYCLGITLYQLLTNIDPCKNVISDKSVRAVNPQLSPGLDEIIIKCTQQQPDDRYQSCEELYYALDHYNEVGEAYKKKQKKKLGTFALFAALSVIFAIISIFGKISANKKITENYDSLIEISNSDELSFEERKSSIFDAIRLAPERTDAYISLVELCLDTNEGDTSVLDRNEAALFSQLKAGIKNGDKEFKPFSELESENPQGSSDVYKEIGFAYWYYYEVENERYKAGADWFKKVSDDDLTAKTFAEIGKQRENIKRLDEQNRTEELYKAYANLWECINNLSATVDSTDDADTKILYIREIIYEISKYAPQFSKSFSVDEIKKVVNSSKNQINNLYREATLEDVKKSLEDLLGMIDGEVSVRLNAVDGNVEEVAK